MTKISARAKITAGFELAGLKLQLRHVIASARAEIIVNTSFNCVFVFHFFQFSGGFFKTQQSHTSAKKRLGRILSGK